MTSPSTHQTANIKTAEVVYVLGGPGVGKGTQCSRLAQDLDIVHISVGEVLRRECERPSNYGGLIDERMRAGSLVPTGVVIAALGFEIRKSLIAGRKRFLVDGFPRNTEQASMFEGEVRAALYFDCSEETMLQRLLRRAETSGRVDDNVETFKKRYQGFLDDSVPVLDFFRSKGLLVRIDCERPLDEIYDDLKEKVQVIFGGTGPS